MKKLEKIISEEDYIKDKSLEKLKSRLNKSMFPFSKIIDDLCSRIGNLKLNFMEDGPHWLLYDTQVGINNIYREKPKNCLLVNNNVIEQFSTLFTFIGYSFADLEDIISYERDHKIVERVKNVFNLCQRVSYKQDKFGNRVPTETFLDRIFNFNANRVYKSFKLNDITISKLDTRIDRSIQAFFGRLATALDSFYKSIICYNNYDIKYVSFNKEKIIARLGSDNPVLKRYIEEKIVGNTEFDNIRLMRNGINHGDPNYLLISVDRTCYDQSYRIKFPDNEGGLKKEYLIKYLTSIFQYFTENLFYASSLLLQDCLKGSCKPNCSLINKNY